MTRVGFSRLWEAYQTKARKMRHIAGEGEESGGVGWGWVWQGDVHCAPSPENFYEVSVLK